MYCNPKVCFKIRVINFNVCSKSMISQLLTNCKTQISQKEELGGYDIIFKIVDSLLYYGTIKLFYSVDADSLECPIHICICGWVSLYTLFIYLSIYL